MAFSGGSQNFGDIGGRPSTGELAGQRPPFPPPDGQNQSGGTNLGQENRPPSPHDSPVDRIEKLLETFGQESTG